MIPKIDLEEIAQRNNMTLSQVTRIIASIRKGMVPVHKEFSVKESGKERRYVVTRHGVGSLKTPNGPFWLLDFFVNDQWKLYSVIVRGKLSSNFTPILENPEKVVMRIDSGCDTGQKFTDITCDCKDQLVFAMQEIAKVGEGLIINMPPQDGRGMGSPFKLATMSLQEQLHLTTVEAASTLTNGGPIDKRSYAGVIAILRFLGISKKREINLLTNNPDKFAVFEQNGYHAVTRMPVVIPPTQHTRKHLESKQLYLGHKDLVTKEDEE
jgi:GTP cyclohydrolase II